MIGINPRLRVALDRTGLHSPEVFDTMALGNWLRARHLQRTLLRP